VRHKRRRLQRLRKKARLERQFTTMVDAYVKRLMVDVLGAQEVVLK
jgi:hypothetical protein